jgi:hypothetical protein
VFAVGGLAFAALELACVALEGGETPNRSAPAATVGKYFRDHAGNVKASQVLAALGIGALLWFFGGLVARLRVADDNPALATALTAGFAVAMALTLVDIATFATAGLGASTLSDGALLLLYDLSTAAIMIGGIGMALFLGAAVASNLRSNVLPRWTNYVATVSAVGFGVGATGIATTSAAIMNLSYLGFMAFCVWVVAVSTSMWRTPS